MGSEYLKITRHEFADDFVWGCASSAYQVEGAYDAPGKCFSNWDNLSLNYPDRIKGGGNGSEAIDQYHRYKEDVMRIKKLGIEAYRFSISWTRIMMGGKLSAGVSQDGVKYYNDLINCCLEHGIEPYVTLFHFDIPQCLEDEYGGFLSTKIVKDFADYAGVCFYEFGDRVKHWFTINESWSYVYHAYIAGYFPPFNGDIATESSRGVLLHRSHRRSKEEIACLVAESSGDHATEPYIAAHNLILAHAAAVDVYRKKFQLPQGGKIGIVNMSTFPEPHTDSEEDKVAAERALDFMWGWFTSPIVHGHYPQVMRRNVGRRLPKFTEEEKKLVKGSFDFIGMNYYTSVYVANSDAPPNNKNPSYSEDMQVVAHYEKDGVPIGPNPGSEWLYIVPRGLTNLLIHNKEKYGNPPVIITENGMSEIYDKPKTIPEAVKDTIRLNYFQDHLIALKHAVQAGVNCKAYFLWSIFDNFEWSEGYGARFGIYYVDFVNGLKRYPKDSAIWWMNFLSKKTGAGHEKRELLVKGSQNDGVGSTKRRRE